MKECYSLKENLSKCKNSTNVSRTVLNAVKNDFYDNHCCTNIVNR